MTNHHDSGLVGGLSSTVHTWRERRRTRRELAEWSKRDLHDVGLSWSELSAEAAKPFWRA